MSTRTLGEIQDCTMRQAKLLLQTPSTNTGNLGMHRHPRTLPEPCCSILKHHTVPTHPPPQAAQRMSDIPGSSPPVPPYQPAPAPGARTALGTLHSWSRSCREDPNPPTLPAFIAHRCPTALAARAPPGVKAVGHTPCSRQGIGMDGAFSGKSLAFPLTGYKTFPGHIKMKCVIAN